jgi:iron complex transport system substrate-binding protein
MRDLLRCCVWLLCLWGGALHALTVTDDRQAQVTVDRVPQRIVSLLPSLSETVCVLGACDRLVGVDRYSNWPPSVARLPHLGGLEDTQVEALLRLKPDLVLLARSSRVTSRLESLGLKVLALEPQSLSDVQRVLLTLAQVLGLPEPAQRADQLWRELQAGLRGVAQDMPTSLRGTRVYFEAGAGGYAASEASFMGEILQSLGLQNVVPASLGSFPKLNPEFVVRADPDFILLGETAGESLQKRPGWASLRAVRTQRVCAFDRSQVDVLVRSGPRMVDAARGIVECLKKHASP